MAKISEKEDNFPHSGFVERIIEILGDARMVGGCVRDTIARKPVKDIDIATPFAPEKVTELLENASIKVIPTGIKHGTVTAISGKESVEVTTLRRDVECYGRYAEVEFTNNWEEDAARRDFTINAMFMDIDGNIYDFFDGQEDLKKGVVKFVGDPQQRVQEDYLRILRYFRFEAYYGTHAVDKPSLMACIKNRQKIQELSGERIQNEMFKLLRAPDPFYVLTLMKEEGVLEQVLYGDTSNTDVGAIRHLVAIEKEEGSVIPAEDAIIRLALLLTEGKAQAERVCDNWKCSNVDRKQLLELVEPANEINTNLDEPAQKRLLITLGKQDFVRQLIFKWAQDDENEHIGTCKRMLALANTWNIPQFPLQGKDILQLGVVEGEMVGHILRKAQDVWEESNYKLTKQRLLTLIKKEIIK